MVNKIVRRSFSFCNKCQVSLRAPGSMPDVGSSSITILNLRFLDSNSQKFWNFFMKKPPILRSTRWRRKVFVSFRPTNFLPYRIFCDSIPIILANAPLLDFCIFDLLIVRKISNVLRPSNCQIRHYIEDKVQDIFEFAAIGFECRNRGETRDLRLAAKFLQILQIWQIFISNFFIFKTKPVSIDIVVDFPAPLCPSNLKNFTANLSFIATLNHFYHQWTIFSKYTILSYLVS